jgi:hypothetical protein
LGWGFTALQRCLRLFELPREVGKDNVSHWRVSPGSFACSVTADTRVLGLSSHPQELPSYNLKPSIWRESEGYQCIKSLEVTGRWVYDDVLLHATSHYIPKITFGTLLQDVFIEHKYVYTVKKT